jgi:hypothetical protein
MADKEDESNRLIWRLPAPPPPTPLLESDRRAPIARRAATRCRRRREFVEEMAERLIVAAQVRPARKEERRCLPALVPRHVSMRYG